MARNNISRVFRILSLVWLHWIEKRSSRGCLEQHLKLSDTNYDEGTYCTLVMVRGPIAR